MPSSSWADGNLAEVAVQLNKMVEFPRQSLPNPGHRADESPCTTSVLVILAVPLLYSQFALGLPFAIVVLPIVRDQILSVEEVKEGRKGT